MKKTTPMNYLALWFKKQARIDHPWDLETSRALMTLCYSVDFAINKTKIPNRNNLTTSELRDSYLDFFCSHNNFIDLYRDLDFFNHFDYPESYISIINEIFMDKFPMERSKLIKMWNLTPTGLY